MSENNSEVKITILIDDQLVHEATAKIVVGPTGKLDLDISDDTKAIMAELNARYQYRRIAATEVDDEA